LTKNLLIFALLIQIIIMKKFTSSPWLVVLLALSLRVSYAQQLYVSTISPNRIYQGQTVKTSYHSQGASFNAGNKFYIELSSPRGDFNNPIIIDSIIDTATQSRFQITFPSNVTPGPAYRLRLRSSSPAITSFTNPENLVIITAAQAGRTDTLRKEWDRRFGTNDWEIAKRTIQSRDGGYFVGGSTYGDLNGDKTQKSQGDEDYWMLKLNSKGQRLANKRYGGKKEEELTSMISTNDNGLLLGGFSSSDTASGDKTQDNWSSKCDVWIVKIDSMGNKVWDKRFGGNHFDRLTDIIQCHDHSYILSIQSNSDSSGDFTSKPLTQGGQIRILKLDSLGNKQWDKRFGGTGTQTAWIKETNDFGYFLIGSTSSDSIFGCVSEKSKGGLDAWLVKLDSQGNKLWDKRYGGTSDDRISKMFQTNDNCFMLLGETSSGKNGDVSQPRFGGIDFWLLKVDSMGNKIWDKRYGGNLINSSEQFINFSDGFIIGGRSNSDTSSIKKSHNIGDYDWWFIKVDTAGNKLWDITLGGSLQDELYDIYPTSDGGIISCGSSLSDISGTKSQDSRGSSDYWVIKLAYLDLQTLPLQKNIYCSGSKTTVGYSFNLASMDSDNIFISQLSDSSGSFASPTVLRKKGGLSADTMNMTIPANIPAGNHYRIRVVSSKPQAIGSDNGRDITIVGKPMVSFTANNSQQCLKNNQFVFVNSSTDNDSNYWIFGKGANDTSTAINPTKIYNAAGTYQVTLTAKNNTGCTASNTQKVYVYPSTNRALSVYICVGSTYTFGGQKLSNAGTYYDTLANIHGCDSMVTLSLNTLPISSHTLSATICQGSSYSFHNKTITQAGVYTDTLVNALNCDSLVTLTLQVNQASNASINASICQGSSYTFNQQQLTQAGVYKDTLANTLGCDSIITLTLAINNLSPLGAIAGPNSKVQNQTADYSITKLSGTHTYTWEANKGNIQSGQGTQKVTVLWNQQGVGEVKVYTDCSDTVSLSVQVLNGMMTPEQTIITLYPNPTDGKVYISTNQPFNEIRLTDITGKQLAAYKQNSSQAAILDLSEFANGVYIIELMNQGNILKRERMVVHRN
jgi:PKD repeat protein